MDKQQRQIDQIRAASRTMVRELGFMRATLADTSLSPSAVHTLLEIDSQAATTAAQLAQILSLDKSSVSRMLSKLIDAGLITETLGENDGRSKQLYLSDAGKQLVTNIHAFSQQKVSDALACLNPSQQQAVVQGLTAYAQALQTHRYGRSHMASPPITIIAGYQPGLIGRITEMHAAFYARHAGFGAFFESKVASGVAEFIGHLDQPCNRIWAAMLNDRIVGSVAIDGEDLGNNQAHLRWFIMDDHCRGNGIGRQLLSHAIAFCDLFGFSATQLDTFKGLDVARRLYESFNFTLQDERQGTQWGSLVSEQTFTRPATGPAAAN